jgi:hypothetical protein
MTKSSEGQHGARCAVIAADLTPEMITAGAREFLGALSDRLPPNWTLALFAGAFNHDA